MNGHRLVFPFLFALLFQVNNVWAQAPKYSNEFLAIGVGARGMGMANTLVASVNDVTGGYWNPASLPLAEQKWQVALMHSEYFAGIAKYDYAAVSAPIVDQHTQASFSFIRFGVDDIPNTTQLIDDEGNIDYDRVTSFTAADYGFLISVGRRSPKIPGLRYGGTVKVVYRHVGKFANAWGFGLDGGVQYDLKNWKFGLMARDQRGVATDRERDTEELFGGNATENDTRGRTQIQRLQEVRSLHRIQLRFHVRWETFRAH